MSGKKEKKEKQMLPLVFFALAALFVFLFFLPEEKPALSNKKNPHSAQYEKAVNKHLFRTSQNIEHAQEKMALETAEMASQGIKAIQIENPSKGGVDLSIDPRTEALLKELGREIKDSDVPINAHELVQAELFEAQQLREYTEEYKREYARQFVENARKAGYIIKLNDQYKVIFVQPIRKPTNQFQLYESGSGAVQ